MRTSVWRGEPVQARNADNDRVIRSRAGATALQPPQGQYQGTYFTILDTSLPSALNSAVRPTTGVGSPHALILLLGSKGAANATRARHL
jgi:hypothetical protein